MKLFIAGHQGMVGGALAVMLYHLENVVVMQVISASYLKVLRILTI